MIKLARSDALFPARLLAIYDPPPALYLRGAGSPDLLAGRAVAVVGRGHARRTAHRSPACSAASWLPPGSWS